LWWKALDDETAARLVPFTGDFKYFLEEERMFKTYTLAEREEQIINLKDSNGMHGLVTVYDMLSNRLSFNLNVNGTEKKLTRGELQGYFRDPSPAVRSAAYREMMTRFAGEGAILAQIYSSRVLDWSAEQVRLRHFASPISVRNLANDVPDAAVQTLIDVCRANASVFQDYFRKKAGWLGLDQFSRTDIYAPLATSTKTFDYGDGVDMVLESYESFSPQFADLARRVYADKHVDAEVRPGKRAGAFCMSVLPQLTPYVHLNYSATAKDVSTMAHEFGHAIHFMLAGDHTTFTFHAPLPLAETASLFGETMMTDHLLAIETDPAVRRDLLAGRLDDTYANVMRQAYFTIFEQEAHALIAQGKSADDLCAAYLLNLREQFGPAIPVGDDFKWEWVSIHHFFHVPFYTYAYSFGNLLALALYKEYLAHGQSFIPRYVKILSYGGSAKPADILNEAGIDMTSAAFWQGGFDLVKTWVTELETLPAPAH
jgi:oligoendopeptidase F